MFFKLLFDAMKVKQVRNRILFTIWMLFVFRLGTHITVPGINVANLNKLSDLPFLNMMNLVSGNAMKNFSIFSMGVSPYITASIIVQLLQMDILPKFVEWSKQGEVGRRKLNQATRYFTLALAMAQSVGITAAFNSLVANGIVSTPTWQTYLLIGAILTTGCMVVVWIGEQISAKGFGGGMSVIIFAGIVSGLPGAFSEVWEDKFVNVASSQIPGSIIFTIGLLIAIAIIVFATTLFTQAMRKIPIQYTKLVQGASNSSYLPLRLNPAGVIPVIFASSITSAPATLLQFFKDKDWGWLDTMQKAFDYTTPIGIVVYAILIALFTFFYAFVQVNPEKLAENLQKQGSYIPSVRPGKSTEKYISSLLIKLSTVGAIFLAVISIVPIVAQDMFGLPRMVALGGTSLLIVISTALQGTKQLEGYLMKRQYTGFMDNPAEI
jgi:preprotein translocase subunit SecY